MLGIIPKRIVVFSLSVVLVVAVVYVLNFWWWDYAAPKTYLVRLRLTQNDTLFLEGLFLSFLGLLVMMGSGGINLYSVKAAILGAAADAVFSRKGRKAPGPSEIFRRDLWKSSRSFRSGLIIMLSGIVLIVLYFVL